MRLRHYSESEQRSIARALECGCAWHGRLLSDACCECGMIRFYRKEVGREADEK